MCDSLAPLKFIPTLPGKVLSAISVKTIRVSTLQPFEAEIQSVANKHTLLHLAVLFWQVASAQAPEGMALLADY